MNRGIVLFIPRRFNPYLSIVEHPFNNTIEIKMILTDNLKNILILSILFNCFKTFFIFIVNFNFK